MKRLLAVVAGLAVVAAAIGLYHCWPLVRAHLTPAPRSAPTGAPRRAWAKPLDEPALKNFHRVSRKLYRGAQPDGSGMRRLEELGIRTVVNLRMAHSDRDELAGTKLAYVHIRVNPADPEEDEVVRFLRVATDPNRTPVFVHCQRGIDRTGMMCAVYRIAVEGWSKAEAIREMTEGGFGYDHVFANVVRYLWRMDVEELKRRVRDGGG